MTLGIDFGKGGLCKENMKETLEYEIEALNKVYFWGTAQGVDSYKGIATPPIYQSKYKGSSK